MDISSFFKKACIIFFLPLLFGCGGGGDIDRYPSDPSPKISVSESSYDFGGVVVDNSSDKTFTIKNTGNKMDDNITINVTSAPEGWITTLDTIDLPYTGLERGAVANIYLTIQTPKQVVIGTYSITIAAISDGEVKDAAVVTVNILNYSEINLTSHSEIINIIPEKDYFFNVNIKNLGNQPSNFFLDHSCLQSSSGLDKFVKLEYTSIFLYPYMSMDLEVTINLPKDFSRDSEV